MLLTGVALDCLKVGGIELLTKESPLCFSDARSGEVERAGVGKEAIECCGVPKMLGS